MMHDPTVPNNFSMLAVCPKCAHGDPYIQYTPHREFIHSDGELLQTRQFHQDSLECFVVTCSRCDYQWTMETKESQKLRR